MKNKKVMDFITSEIYKKYPDISLFCKHAGIPQSTIYNLNKYSRLPSLETYIKICMELDLDMNFIKEFM